MLLPLPITPQLHHVVGIETGRTYPPCPQHTTEDGPDVGHAVFILQHYGHPYHVVNGVRLDLCLLGWQPEPPVSVPDQIPTSLSPQHLGPKPDPESALVDGRVSVI